MDSKKTKGIYTIGLDPSTKRLAIFVLRNGKAIHSEWRPLPTDPQVRLHRAMIYMQMQCKKWGLRARANNSVLNFAIEEPVVGRGGAYVTIAQSKVHGACVAGAIQSGAVANVWAVQNSSWKKFVCGNGKIPKESIPGWMKANWRAAYEKTSTPDEIDAACIAQWGHGFALGKYKPTEKRRRKAAPKKSEEKK